MINRGNENNTDSLFLNRDRLMCTKILNDLVRIHTCRTQVNFVGNGERIRLGKLKDSQA